ncbi:tRNA (adenosine(37)-N6)-threonylcarbamoyltransferase complex ATPase subunit type 1 TsaE [Candidatus Saccharibacteria bacterium]|nr:tRNA (adenosine(37)-N6)-threonylcarbamoyltransferase complex ATPase subunit type 1 TsaE [Candidatus Saccharibacteria bacterium]
MVVINSEQEMLDFGRKLGRGLTAPAMLELIGDVGAGKTTLTRGIAEALGIHEPVTSPSFTISKRYVGKTTDGRKIILAHYDFYRLPDPGIMSEELSETLNDENTITIVEWGGSVKNLLPENHQKIEIKYREDGSREVITS